MFKYFKQPDIPDSSPDMLTFPFEYSTFSFTMDNYVKSYTRNRVTKENLKEIIEEVNSALKTDSDSFKAWDYFSIFLILALNGGILACILTIEMKAFVVFAIKLGYIVVALIMNFVIYGCCLDSSVNRLRDKIQSILDQKDEYFDSKGMKWTVCNGADFPYWVELHIQSQFEMKLEREIEQAAGGKRKSKKSDRDNENKGILVDSTGHMKYQKKGGLFGNKKNNQQQLIGFEVDEEDEEAEQDTSQVQPRAQRLQQQQQQNNHAAQQNRDEVEIEVKDRKFDRLYAPLEEDYEENYEDEEALSN